MKATLGWNNSIIGHTVGLHYNAFGIWINAYKANGFEALLSNNYGSKKSELENHADSILKSFQLQPPMTAAGAVERIREMTGISRSDQQVRAFMKRHELKFIKCGHIPAKADNDQQHQWVETELKPVIGAAQKEWQQTVDELSILILGRASSEHVFINRCKQPLTRFGIHTIVKRYAKKIAKQLPSIENKRVSPHTGDYGQSLPAFQ